MMMSGFIHYQSGNTSRKPAARSTCSHFGYVKNPGNNFTGHAVMHGNIKGTIRKGFDMKANRSKNPSRRLYAEKSKIVAKLKRLRIIIYDRKENGILDHSLLDEYRHKVNKFVDEYEKDNLPWGVKLTRRQALYWKEKIRKTCIDVKDNIVEDQMGDIKKSQKLRVESNYCTMVLSKDVGEAIENDGDEPFVEDKDEDEDEVMSSSSQSVTDSDEENMSGSESQYEYVYVDADSVFFSGDNGEDIDLFLSEIEYLLDNQWHEDESYIGEGDPGWDPGLLDRYKEKEGYDLLMNYLSEPLILIARNEEHDYLKAFSELKFRYGDSQTVVRDVMLQVEGQTRNSILKQPDPEQGEWSRSQAIERERFQLNNLKQMAVRDERFRKVIQDEPRNVDRIISLLPEDMEMRFMDDVVVIFPDF